MARRKTQQAPTHSDKYILYNIEDTIEMNLQKSIKLYAPNQFNVM